MPNEIQMNHAVLNCLAYIDPGSGSFLLQMLLAGLFGVAAFFRKYIFGWFRRGKDQEASSDESELDAPAAKKPDTVFPGPDAKP